MRKFAITTRTMMFLIVFVVWALYAQSQSQATIKGMVFDQNGKPLPGVKIEIYNTPLQTRTSPEGLFSLEDISPGKYKLVFTHPDYKTEPPKILCFLPLMKRLQSQPKPIPLSM